jgi:glycosyltransferase involved in cell wall biosynthesis
MRILTVLDHLGPGGRQRTAQNFSIGYADAGHEAAVMAVFAGGPRVEHLNNRGIPTFIGAKTLTEREPAIVAAAAWMPDVIHLHSKGPLRFAVGEAVEAILERLPHRPPVLETSSFGKVDYGQRFTFSDVYLLKARWALWKWRRWSRSFRPRPHGVVVPNVVDTAAFCPTSGSERTAFRATHGLPEDTFLLGRIGQPSRWKWDPVVFDVFAEVAARHRHAHLLLIGLPDEFRPRLKALDPAVGARVVEIPFLHGDDALRRCYGALDVFLHAARIGESFGTVLAEAMACACPVVTLSTPSRDNSQIEVVGHERGGFVVHDRGGMVEAIERLIADGALRERLGRDGAAHVRSTYTLERVVPTLLRIIELARSTPDREAFGRSLAAEPDLVTDVSDDEIEALLTRTLGRPSLRQRLLMNLVHTPLLFRAWWTFKGLRYGRTLPNPSLSESSSTAP